MFSAALKSGAAATPTDPQFNYVTMLLHGDGTNGGQNNTFLDSSTNNFTITRNGNTTQGSFSPYGSNWSNYFNGSNTTLQSTAINISTGNWTVEAWVFLNAMPTSDNWPGSYTNWMVITSVGTAGQSDGWQFRIGQTVLAFGTNGDSTAVSATHGMSVGQWYHLAVTKSGNVYTLYKNGTSIGSATYTANAPGTGAYTWTASETNEGAYLNGYLSNVRIVVGTAVYTGTFTPSTTPLTAISGTAYLTCQSNRFIDNSSNNYSITANGSPSVQRFSPFSPSASYSTATIGGSGYFDGTGDQLTATQATMQNATFTVEFWVYPFRFTDTNNIIYSAFRTGTGYQGLVIGSNSSGQIFCDNGMAAQITTAQTMKLYQWNHIAATRDNSTGVVKVFVNGTLDANTATFNPPATDNVLISSYWTQTDRMIQGYMTDFRVVRSVVYTASFTPPTAPLTAVTNTSLLLNFTNGSIFDNAMMNDLETVGNAQISTSVKKYGTGSLAFDGSGDWLAIPSSQNFNFGSGNFTVEMWINTTQTTSNATLITREWGGSPYTGGWSIQLNGDSSSAMTIYWADYSTGSTFMVANTTSYRDGSWHHVAWVRNGTSFVLYIDGVSVATATSSTAFGASTKQLTIGNDQTFGAGARAYNGYIDDLRITKGYARYTANFSVPTAAFPNN